MFYYSIKCTIDEESVNAIRENRSAISSRYSIAGDEIYSESKNTQIYNWIDRIHVCMNSGFC